MSDLSSDLSSGSSQASHGLAANRGCGVESLRECPDCGHFSQMPDLRPGADARCPRCDGTLRRERQRPLETAFAWSCAGMLFYLVAIGAPFLQLQLHGQARLSKLETGPEALNTEGLWEVALAVILFTIVMPFIKLAINLVVLIGLRLPRPPKWLPIPFRWQERISPWAMIEVYLLGLFVAYTRLVALAQVHIETAAYALVGLMICIVGADAALDPETVWREMQRRGVVAKPEASVPREGGQLISCHVCHQVNMAEEGHACCRCGTALHRRKPGSLARTAALCVSALTLYIPANTNSVMNITRLGRTLPHTILGGARELLEAGMWPLALLVFFASITVPVLKLVGLSLMLITTQRGTSWRLIDRTRLYRIVEFIGRWSMIDVFMISILVALVHFGQLADITSDTGAIAFAGVVILTMFASHSFDPRLMWDAAAQNEHTSRDRQELEGEAGGVTT